MNCLPGVGAEDHLSVLPDDLCADLGVDGHVAHAEDEAAGIVCEGVVNGAPPARDDLHVGLVQLLVMVQDDLALWFTKMIIQSEVAG